MNFFQATLFFSLLARTSLSTIAYSWDWTSAQAVLYEGCNGDDSCWRWGHDVNQDVTLTPAGTEGDQMTFSMDLSHLQGTAPDGSEIKLKKYRSVDLHVYDQHHVEEISVSGYWENHDMRGKSGDGWYRRVCEFKKAYHEFTLHNNVNNTSNQFLKVSVVVQSDNGACESEAAWEKFWLWVLIIFLIIVCLACVLGISCIGLGTAACCGIAFKGSKYDTGAKVQMEQQAAV